MLQLQTVMVDAEALSSPAPLDEQPALVFAAVSRTEQALTARVLDSAVSRPGSRLHVSELPPVTELHRGAVSLRSSLTQRTVLASELQ